MKLKLIIVLMMLGGFTANAQNPYEIFGHKSNVEYKTRISDLFSVVNTDTTSLIQKMVFKFDENKIISYDKNDNIIAIENIAPNQILRFLSIDAHAESYPSTSPYAYCLNNPMNAIDPDGKDVIVLNNPNGAEGFGHMAVLVGNDKDGWTYISKEGRDKNPWYSNQLTGGPALTKIRPFTSLEAFQQAQKTDKDLGGYTQNVRFSTTTEQDNTVKSTTTESAKSWYSVLFNNCADAVSDGLAKVGFDPGYTNSYTSVDDGIFSDGKSLKPMPNARFEEIKKNNADKIIPTFSEPQPIIPTNTGQNNTK